MLCISYHLPFKMKNLIKNKTYLQFLSKADKKIRNYLIENATPEQRRALIELIVNTVQGNLKLSSNQIKRLKKYKKHLRYICIICLNRKQNKIINISKKGAKKSIVQVGGILPFLIPPLLALAGKAALGGAISAGAGYATKKIIDSAAG